MKEAAANIYGDKANMIICDEVIIDDPEALDITDDLEALIAEQGHRAMTRDIIATIISPYAFDPAKWPDPVNGKPSISQAVCIKNAKDASTRVMKYLEGKGIKL